MRDEYRDASLSRSMNIEVPANTVNADIEQSILSALVVFGESKPGDDVKTVKLYFRLEDHDTFSRS